VRVCAATSSTDTASGAAVGFSFTDHQYDWGEGRSCHYTQLDGTTATDDDTAPLVFLPGFGVGTFHFEVRSPKTPADRGLGLAVSVSLWANSLGGCLFSHRR